ncbi:MAG TPA: hypothetical protein VK661_02315 [Planctomycetota bacterium]|nr:hypothetical protein [Planctomycetota bacterium]
MTDEPVPPPPVASSSAISLGMSCMVMSVPVLLYSAYDIFYWLARALDVYMSVKVKVDFSTEVLSRYGIALWGIAAGSVILSMLEAYRRPGRPRTVAIQVCAFLATVILAYTARHAMWDPFMSLLQGIGTEK